MHDSLGLDLPVQQLQVISIFLIIHHVVDIVIHMSLESQLVFISKLSTATGFQFVTQLWEIQRNMNTSSLRFIII